MMAFVVDYVHQMGAMMMMMMMMMLPHLKKGNVHSAPVGRRPCTVYGYESAVQPSAVINNSSSLLPHSNVSGLEHEYHHATLDGLCQHGHPGLIMLACHRETIGIDSRERIETR